MPTALVILGATGDLTRRLLMPALYRLYTLGHLDDLEIIGYAMEDWDTERFVSHLAENLETFVPNFNSKKWASFSCKLSYHSGDLTAEKLAVLRDQITGNALFYLALPPMLFGQAADALSKAGFAQEATGWRRLIVEKPFGYDLASAQALREQLHQGWREDQVYRIDHFLGKETTQNMLVFRLANRFLEPVWNTNHIEQVQITVAETLGLEGRWRYYDGAGALRDMLQNHLMQLFALTALEPPSMWDADVLRDHKVEVLRSVRPISLGSVNDYAVRGQYTAGEIDGTKVVGYLEEENIPKDSHTESFAALKLYVDNWRWQGVPFYLRSGKRLAATHSEIAVQFKSVPGLPFQEEGQVNNWIIFQMKPKETIDIVAVAKKPGLDLEGRKVVLSTPYTGKGDIEYSAYEQLLMDALVGDRTHFLRFDEVEWAWRILEPVLEAWKQDRPEGYAAGSQGPQAQEGLLEDGHEWREL